MTRRLEPWIAPAIVALLALAACVTSIGHDFTFDDRYVVLFNNRVHSLHGLWRLFGETYWPKEMGGDGYRPLVMALFTLQWVLGGGAPWVFHLVNILLAIGAALAVYWCAVAVLPRVAAVAAASLFAVHPVHVEVTGNVVGQSELLVATSLCVAVGIYIRARRRGTPTWRELAAILGLFAIGLLSKEHAIVLPALLAAAEFTVVRDASWRWTKPMRVFGLLLVAMSVAFLWILGQVHQNIAGFAPYPAFHVLHMTALDRAFTMLTVIPRIGRLLVFPTHLSGDYAPSDVPIAHAFDVIQIPGLFMCAGLVLLAFALRRRSPVASLGLFWVIIAFAPVSNLLVPAGFIIAERTLFFPSVGVVLVAGAVVAAVVARDIRIERRVVAMATGLLLALGLARSVDRQRVWKNNDVFFEQLVKDVPNSYRAHFLRARVMGDRGRYTDMQREYHKAIGLFPYDVGMMLQIAADYHASGRCRPVISMLKWAYAVEPLAGDGRVAYVQCLGHEGEWAQARREALTGLRVVRPVDVHRLRALVAVADSALGRPRHGPADVHDGRVAIR
jgi:protein O-mannosyl-transferase